MHMLPDEIVTSIFCLLEPVDVATAQLVCRRFLSLGRDNELWRQACFEHTSLEARRRRQELLRTQESTLAALTQAASGMSQANPFAQSRLSQLVTESLSDNITSTRASAHETARSRAFANWDPCRPGEHCDFYQEYLHRYGPISVDWLQSARDKGSANPIEAMGMGVLEDSNAAAQRVVSPLEDGSVALWELSSEAEAGRRGRILERSRPGLLTVRPDAGDFTAAPPVITNETGAIENVSVDSKQLKAYFAVHDTLSEVDLNTLQIIRREKYPFPISTLSIANAPTPMTVGTAMTMHLFDTREQRPSVNMAASSLEFARSEQISGPPPVSPAYALLSQPGPLSVLHQATDIWVAGRFTSLLCYDRRFWPRISRTLFSGARLSSLISLPFGHIPHDHDLNRNQSLSVSDFNAAKSTPGTTLVAVGEYRGKGSVEQYGLREQPHDPRVKTPAAKTFYHNRQTASKSRLLSVAAHGARLVFSDGDGGIKWVERDGCSLVRAFNINDAPYAGAREPRASDTASVDSGYGSSATEASAAPALFREGENSTGDIVQKLVPTRGNGAAGSDAYRTANRDDLLIWTGDGRIGLVGFRRSSAFGAPTDEDQEMHDETSEKERLYEMRMRRALERQADETRFVRGLGLAMGMQ